MIQRDRLPTIGNYSLMLAATARPSNTRARTPSMNPTFSADEPGPDGILHHPYGAVEDRSSLGSAPARIKFHGRQPRQ